MEVHAVSLPIPGCDHLSNVLPVPASQETRGTLLQTVVPREGEDR